MAEFTVQMTVKFTIRVIAENREQAEQNAHNLGVQQLENACYNQGIDEVVQAKALYEKVDGVQVKLDEKESNT